MPFQNTSCIFFAHIVIQQMKKKSLLMKQKLPQAGCSIMICETDDNIKCERNSQHLF